MTPCRYRTHVFAVYGNGGAKPHPNRFHAPAARHDDARRRPGVPMPHAQDYVFVEGRGRGSEEGCVAHLGDANISIEILGCYGVGVYMTANR